jgi:hypothetical protein
MVIYHNPNFSLTLLTLRLIRFDRHFIETAKEISGIKVDLLISPLELVQLLQNGNGDHDFIIMKLMNTGCIVKNDVRIQYEYFSLAFRH